jgi:hypothetical protein
MIAITLPSDCTKCANMQCCSEQGRLLVLDSVLLLLGGRLVELELATVPGFVSSADAIPQSKVLSVVVVEVVVMTGMMSRAVEEAVERRHRHAVMDRDGPDLHKDEQNQVQPVVEREDEHKHVVRCRLSPTIHWVEGNCSPRRWTQKQVVCLVQVPVVVGGAQMQTSNHRLLVLVHVHVCVRCQCLCKQSCVEETC